jgi:hypothetical protein
LGDRHHDPGRCRYDRRYGDRGHDHYGQQHDHGQRDDERDSDRHDDRRRHDGDHHHAR